MAVIEVNNPIVGPQHGRRPGAVFTVGSGYNYSTITLALAACESGRGDTIYVMPGTYDEAVSVSKDYVAIIGLLPGYARPDVAPDSGTSPALSVSGQGFYCEGLRFTVDGIDADVCRITGNGFRFEDCVFDGDAAMGATKALVRDWCDAADDGLTGSEGSFVDCLFRGSPGYGIAADVQDAAVGVGPTHNVVRGCRFISNTAEDVIALETAAGTYSMQDWLFDGCYFGMGTAKNKATHIDLKTNNGVTNTGNVFAGCYINDDTINTTAVKTDTTGSSFIGCYSLDGLIDGDALD